MIALTSLPFSHERLIGVTILAIGVYVALAGLVAWWSTR